MPAIEVGRICIKTRGREAGKRCVIVDLIDKSFVLITGPKSVTGVRRRRANISHLNPTEEKINIRRGASDEEVLRALGLAEEKKEKEKSSEESEAEGSG
jgi:large subunit ribosomal protein L14e